MATSEQQAFANLVRAHQTELYRLAYWLCKNKAQAQDIVQDAFMRAWKSIASLREAGSAKAWLMMIVRREYLRTFERKSYELVTLDAQPIEDSAPDLAARGDADAVRQAIAELEPKYRIPLVLQVIGGLSCAEIAQDLRISEAAVMTQLFRARQKIKHALDEPTDAARDNVIRPTAFQRHAGQPKK
jgi:RNA polymerase sigma-70 factor, ECF subfamily